MLRSLLGREKTLLIHTHRYLLSPHPIDYLEIAPGPHKVVVDETGRFIIGYAGEWENGYVLYPFVEKGPRHSEPKRIKMRIRGEFATSYITILPTDPLYEKFFKLVSSPERIVDVKAIPNPADEAAVASTGEI